MSQHELEKMLDLAMIRADEERFLPQE